MHAVHRFLLLAWACTATQEDFHNILRPHSASKDQSGSHLKLEVVAEGVNSKKTSFSLLRSERYSKRSSDNQEALLDTNREASPEFGTTDATCDGTVISCTGGQDPCVQAAVDACIGLYHACEGGARKRCEVKDGQCKTGSECYDMCEGYYFDKKSSGAAGNPSCSDLNTTHCQGGYVSVDGSTTGAGVQCELKDELTCVEKKRCAIQNPPEVLGEVQCVAPEVTNGNPVSTCEGSKRVRPNFQCKTQCRSGFTPDKSALNCEEEGKLVPETFTCVPNDCSAPTIENGDPNGVCEEGAKVRSGSNCTVSCKPGYSPDVESVACYAEAFSPSSFYCQKDCPAPTTANALGGSICKEAGGGSVKAFTKCTLQCADGYDPNTPKAECNAGKLFPEKLECLPKPCPAPTGIDSAASNGACKDQDSITSGGQCTTQCMPGYTASVASLACLAGTLTPPAFTCQPDTCVAPTVNNAETPSCGNGANPPHGSTCKTQCKQGFTPTIASLTCDKGILTGPGGEPTFRCVEDPCAAPKVINSKESASCQEGASIPALGLCTVACAQGYQASKAQVKCVGGSLTEIFTCEPKSCPHPQQGGNALGCQEDGPIPSGKHCTAKCADGSLTSPPNLKMDCFAGKLTPSTFSCGEDPCPAPTGIANAHTDGACAGGKTMIDSAQSCTATCRNGYQPSAPTLTCNRGTLAPPSFTCAPLGCQVPSTGGRGCEGKAAGSEISHGEVCKAKCDDATHKPSQDSVKCTEGIMPSFSCGMKGCDLPSVTNGGCVENEIPHGGTCTTKCDTNFVPSVATLACSGGSLIPTTFICERFCTPPDSITCSEGTVITSRSACTVSCKNGGTSSVAQISCTDGIMANVECTLPLPTLARTRKGTWAGDPHFRDAGANSDPLRPGTQFATKVDCPETGAKNWLISEVLQGPMYPSGSMGFAITGAFMQFHVWKAVVTDKGFIATYDGANINNGWSTKVGDVQLSATIRKKKISFVAGDWVRYTGTRSHWKRSKRPIVIDSHPYKNYYLSNNELTWGVCKGGRTMGVLVEGYGYGNNQGAMADRVPPDDSNMFLKPHGIVATYLKGLGETIVKSRCFKKNRGQTYTELPEGTGGAGWDRGCPPCQKASACARESAGLLIEDDSKTIIKTDAERRAEANAEAEELALVNITNKQRLNSLVTNAGDEGTFDCSEAAMADAKSKCAPVEGGEVLDHDNKMSHDAVYVACVFDVCVTHDPEVAEQAQEIAASEQKNSILHHKFHFLACPTACPSGLKETSQDDADLSGEEKLHLADALTDAAFAGMKFCRSDRAYVVTSPVFHTGTRWQSADIEGACEKNRLARPRTQAARDAAKEAINDSMTPKVWIGGSASGDPLRWKWYDWNAAKNEEDVDIDIASIAIGGTIDNAEGAHNFLCMDQNTGNLAKCDIDANATVSADISSADQVPMAALCETVFYEPVHGQATNACS